MRSKYYLVVLFLVLFMLLSGCCLFENLRADVVITKWEQDYSGGKWSDQVKVYYTITNTGNVHIGCYNIWFSAYCEDGKIYEDWNSTGYFVWIGHSEDRTCWIIVGENKKVISVDVTDLILKAFIVPLQLVN